MTTSETTASPPPRWRRALRAVYLVLVAVAVVAAVADRWEEVTDSWRQLSALGLASATAAALAAVATSCAVWRTYLGGLGHRLRLTAAGRIFFVSQLGKYMPGSVWPVLAQMEYGRDYGIAPRASASSVALFLTTHIAVGALIASLVLPLSGVVSLLWLAAAVPAAALLVPGLQGTLVSFTLRRLRRQPLPALPDARTGLAASAWALGTWVAWGAQLWLLLAALGATVSPLVATGAFAAAWLIGFAVLPAPAGAGVREAVLVALLVPFVPTGAALTIALVSRLLLTIADLGWGAVGLAGVRPALVNRGD